ncbi:hypothetical protein V9T40_007232 [Parthenolecanium corni]|uniref:Retrovirus-related Pol polyprotein from transposon TNT 1-94 n=1 Tax=Parthenolecanium corni TaxID=536013 RepID=A0AAN9YBF6_9HEMI
MFRILQIFMQQQLEMNYHQHIARISAGWQLYWMSKKLHYVQFWFVKANGLYDVVVNDPPQPANRSDAWKRENFKAKAVLVENLDDSQLSYSEKPLAHDIWAALERTFERKSYLQLAYHCRRLYSLRYDGKGDLGSFFKEMEDIISEVRTSGLDFSEKHAVVTLFSALPGEFNSVIAAFGDMNSNSLTMDQVKGSLLDFDLKQKDTAVSGKSSGGGNTHNAFKAFSSGGGSEQHSSNGPGTRFPFKCNYCGQKGHKASSCFKKKRGQPKGVGSYKPSTEASNAEGSDPPEGSSINVAFIAEACASIKEGSSHAVTFALDSACTEHMVGDASLFRRWCALSPKQSVRLAEDSVTYAEKKGNLYPLTTNTGYVLKLDDVLYLPNFRRNLLSVRQLDRAGYTVNFKGGSVTVSDTNNVTVIQATSVGNMYLCDFNISFSESNAVMCDDIELMHERLGHLNEKSLLFLKKSGRINFSGKFTKVCDGCRFGKQTKLPHISSHTKVSEPLELVSSDVCCANLPSYCDNRYFVTFVDHFTNFVVIYVLKHKSGVFSVFREYEARTRNKFGRGIQRLRTDNGTEYVSEEFESYCAEKGIVCERTIPYTPQMNGKAERLNRTLVEKARCLLHQSGLEKTYWDEAIQCAAYQLNRCPNYENKIPAELWYGKDVDYSKLKKFGCLVHLLLPKQKRDKFDPVSRKCVMIGYASNGYRLLDPLTNKVVLGRDVRFDESRNYRDIVDVVHAGDAGEFSSQQSPEVHGEEVQSTSNSKHETADSLPTTVSRPVRNRKPPKRFEDYEVSALLCETYESEALSSQSEVEKWLVPKQEELNAMKKHAVWSLVPRHPKMNVIPTKWIVKEKDDGRLRARLVAMGCCEIEMYENVYSPVVNMFTVKLFLSYVISNSLHLHHMDVKNAFLHGELNYDVFIEQPPGFGTGRNLVCKLNKAIYGLKISPILWNKCINDFLVNELGFRRSEMDACFYSKFNGNNVTLILIYVDDILFASNNVNDLLEIKSKLGNKFDMVDLKEVKQFLGINISYSNNVMTLSQEKYIEKLIRKFDQASFNVYTPIEKNLKLEVNENGAPNVKLPYRQLIGSLLYVSMATRPDICYSVNYFSKFQSSYTDEHYKYLLRILCYLKVSKQLKLTYRNNKLSGIETLQCFVDADWGNDIDRKSVSGYLIRFLGNPVVWATKKQHCISLSSTEAEYIALSTFVHHALNWVVELVSEFKVTVDFPILIYEDNVAVINILDTSFSTKRSKHIDIRCKYLKEVTNSEFIKLKYIKSVEQPADIFTKGLDRVTFERLRSTLNVI